MNYGDSGIMPYSLEVLRRRNSHSYERFNRNSYPDRSIANEASSLFALKCDRESLDDKNSTDSSILLPIYGFVFVLDGRILFAPDFGHALTTKKERRERAPISTLGLWLSRRIHSFRHRSRITLSCGREFVPPGRRAIVVEIPVGPLR